MSARSSRSIVAMDATVDRLRHSSGTAGLSQTNAAIPQKRMRAACDQMGADSRRSGTSASARTRSSPGISEGDRPLAPFAQSIAGCSGFQPSEDAASEKSTQTAFLPMRSA